jgi:hypothetical protein
MSRLIKFVVIRIYVEHEMEIAQKEAEFIVIEADGAYSLNYKTALQSTVSLSLKEV